MAPSKLALLLALTVLSLAAAVHGGCKSHCPTPPVVPTPSGGGGSCPINALKLSVCANVLNLLRISVPPEHDQCCPLLQGLVDLDAAVCLCTAIKANLLGINLNVPVDLTLLLNHCGKTCPADFTCPK
ncbi:hypothetical protein ACP70R_013247 [Stipagrostis hirtigluma subsp. patula]